MAPVGRSPAVGEPDPDALPGVAHRAALRDVSGIGKHGDVFAEGGFADVEQAQQVYEEKLDSSFFRVRLDRTTELEQAYLRAMADLGPEPQLAGDVARILKRSSQQCAPTRAGLIEKGLLYTPGHGYAAFTVPRFDQFMHRSVPKLVVPPVKPRSKRTRASS